MTQRTALILLAGLVATLAVYFVTQSNAVVGVMGVVLLLLLMELQRHKLP